MFYENQSKERVNKYKKFLRFIGESSKLFSENSSPYLPYRFHENAFCKAFEAENLGRLDCSADAKYGSIGIGLKTWTGRNDQKIAEFGKLKKRYDGLQGLDLVKLISKYRNDRIRVTKNMHGIDCLVYHVVKRDPGKMIIFEYDFDFIDIEKIKLIRDKGNINNTYFTDENHVYHFSTSKNTLYMIFENPKIIDSIDVKISKDPFESLESLVNEDDEMYSTETFSEKRVRLCLKLYSETRNKKIVYEKSGLNQWNARGRVRNSNELYIPYPIKDRRRNEEFFPPRDQVFKLNLPDGKIIDAKVCQDQGKAIMSNPNKVLGKWLLRDVLELSEGTLVTYEMLEELGIDCVVFEKIGELEYSINFAPIGTYEDYYEA